jgi:hypothetical protein
VKRKVWVLVSYLDDMDVMHHARQPGVTFGGSHFGRTRAMYRGLDGKVVCRKIRSHMTRTRDR